MSTQYQPRGPPPIPVKNKYDLSNVGAAKGDPTLNYPHGAPVIPYTNTQPPPQSLNYSGPQSQVHQFEASQPSHGIRPISSTQPPTQVYGAQQINMSPVGPLTTDQYKTMQHQNVSYAGSFSSTQPIVNSPHQHETSNNQIDVLNAYWNGEDIPASNERSNLPNLSKAQPKYLRSYGKMICIFLLFGGFIALFTPIAIIGLAVIIFTIPIYFIVGCFYSTLPNCQEITGQERDAMFFNMAGTWILHTAVNAFDLKCDTAESQYYAMVNAEGEATLMNPLERGEDTYCTKALHKIKFYRSKNKMFMKVSMLKGPWGLDLDSGAEDHRSGKSRGQLGSNCSWIDMYCQGKADYNQEIYDIHSDCLQCVEYKWGYICIWERTQHTYRSWVNDIPEKETWIEWLLDCCDDAPDFDD